MQSFSMRPAEAYLCSQSPSTSGRLFQQVSNVLPARHLQAQRSQRRHPLRATSTDVSCDLSFRMMFPDPSDIAGDAMLCKLLKSRAMW